MRPSLILHPPALDTGPVLPGSVLYTNKPNGHPIKPLPIELVSAGVIGPRSGWATSDDAIVGASLLTSRTHGSAAVVRAGDRFVVHALSNWGSPLSLSTTLSNFGGGWWVHPEVVAFVDGAWVERIRPRVG